MGTERMFDQWSLVHVAFGAILTVYLGPLLAFWITFAFEAIEFLGQKAQAKPRKFWNEKPLNRWIGDIISNVLGIVLAVLFFEPNLLPI